MLNAKAREKRRRGGAQGGHPVEPQGTADGTRIDIVTDLTLSVGGTVRLRHRPGRVAAARRQVRRLSREAQLVAETPEQAAAAVADTTKPVSGLSLGLRAIWRSIPR